MTLSIQDIIDNVSLRTRLLTGGGRTHTTLRWAHVCELPDPSEWLGEGDLLMTTGIGIPHDAKQQHVYVRLLHEAKVAGLMIGENMQAPDDLTGLSEQAAALDFPVLITHYSVPFSAVTKVILDARQLVEDQRRRAVVKIYESARIGLRHLGLSGLLQRLSADVGAELYLFDTRAFRAWDKDLKPLPESWSEVLNKRSRPTFDLARCHNGELEGLVMALPALPDCAILATGGQLLDYGMLHHITSVLAIELERVQSEHQRMLRLGSELLDDLFHLRLSDQAAAERLHGLGLPPTKAFLVLARPIVPLPENWPLELMRLDKKSLIKQTGDELVIVLTDRGAIKLLQSALDCGLGVSGDLLTGSRLTDALREARLALAHTTINRPVVDYAHALDEAFWLPSDLSQALRMYRRVLGALSDYDEQNGSRLVETLRVFLEQNRSWQKSSLLLKIHKQTLVYRIRRIEEITGRSLDDTEGVVALWIALRSMDLVGQAKR